MYVCMYVCMYVSLCVYIAEPLDAAAVRQYVSIT
jgi:hypothetical protein